MSLFQAFLEAPSSGSLFSLSAAYRGVEITRDVVYGDDPRHQLDVYRPPEGISVNAVILFIYGGGWDSGQRQMYGFAGAALASRGYLTVIPDYRLYPAVRYPDFMADTALAYQWAENHRSSNLAGDIPLILMGHSAGAHIAALLAYDRRYLDGLNEPVERPAGLIGMSGPYGFDAKAHARSRAVFAPAKSEDEVKPMTHVRTGAAPALLIHGRKDTTVQTLNAIQLRDALQSVGSAADLVVFKHAGHIEPLLALTWPHSRMFNVTKPIDRFIAARAGKRLD